MLFYNPLFLFIFMPVVFLGFYLSNRKIKDFILLFSSLFFYFWGEPRFIFIALFSTTIDYLIGQFIYRNLAENKAKYYLILGITLNIGLLFYFKYVDFFISSINQLLKIFHFSDLHLLNIALPIGVSFIVFEKITYLVDIYRAKTEPADSLKNYLLYIFLFPKLLAGPIVKYHDIASQLKVRRIDLKDFFDGLQRFLIGMIKKILLADTLGEAANAIFNVYAPLNDLGFSTAWLGVVFFTLQIYLDFSAYSDMAIGLAQMFGFKLLENFNRPYIATSFTDFWRRWHISLSTWIKEYLYLPLGGNQCSVKRIYFNLWVCFLISGLWHGAKCNFLLWGIYNGFFLVIDKLFWLKVSKNLPRVINIIITLFFVMMGWVIFRCDSFHQIVVFFSALSHPGQEGRYLYITQNTWLALGIGVIISFFPVTSWFKRASEFWQPLKIASSLSHWIVSGLSLLAMSRILVSTFNPFLYFRF